MSEVKSTTIKEVQGGATAAKGFKAAGVACSIKQSGRKDVAIIACEKRVPAAAVFTTNKVAAAPVLLSKESLCDLMAQAIVVNSGNANACTGQKGYEDATKMAEIAGEELIVDPQDIIVASTGIIGVPLPMEKVEEGIKAAVHKLAAGEKSARDAAEAIMTTDTFSKEYAVEVSLNGKEVMVGGMAKGSGMIAPNMATMLAFITTDAGIEPVTLNNALKASVEKSFNSITVDGDTSTNDMVVLLASGESGVEIDSGNLEAFQQALDKVCIELAKLIVRDGEGATKLIEIEVNGAVNGADAKKAALAVANSNLVKTAMFGQDPNWGRIVAAVGYSSADVDQSKIDVYYGDQKLVADGHPIPYDSNAVEGMLKEKEIKVTIGLKLGDGVATVWTCDFSYDYVRINAEYHT